MLEKSAHTQAGLKLIYHKDTNAISPFDKAIIELAENNGVSIVCPYIGMDYFNRIVSLAKDWQLITDMQEWLLSHLDMEARNEIKKFIVDNLSNIHHCRNVHAKVIIADDKAFVGSSNLTDSGIKKRIEMSVLIEQREKVNELKQWFQDLWSGTETVSREDLEQFMDSIRLTSLPKITESKISLPSKPVSINAKLVNIEDNHTPPVNIIRDHKESHKRLVESVKILLNRDWVNSYFDLARELIEFTGLRENNQRLTMSIIQSRKIPITINSRYVLRPSCNGQVGLIMPLEYAEQNYDKDGVVEEDDEYFSENRRRVARWLRFERKSKVEFSENIKTHWKQMVMQELRRCTKSSHRRFHEPAAYKVVVDSVYRNDVLDEAFPP